MREERGGHKLNNGKPQTAGKDANNASQHNLGSGVVFQIHPETTITYYNKVQCTNQTLKQCNKLWHSTGLQIHPETTNDALQQSAVY